METVASATAIRSLFQCSALELAQRAEKGNLEALSYFKKMGRCLGLAISNLCMVFEPSMIVIGGKIARAMHLFEPSMRNEITLRLKNHNCKAIAVRKAAREDLSLIHI